jgi:hypothetical protein
LKEINIPNRVKLFTADATTMYTSIDIETGLQAFEATFSTYRDSIPNTFPKELFLSTLEIIMKNNNFTFGNTQWLQLHGTAVGIPAAPLYSTITLSYH